MGYGQGSLRPDRRNPKKWVARYRGNDGRQHSKTFDRKIDGQAFLATIQADKLRGVWLDPRGGKVTFDEWAWKWLNGRKRISDLTRVRDEGLLRNHILPRFGDTPIGKIGPLDVRQWSSELAAVRSADLVRRSVTMVGAIMRAAVIAKMIPESPVITEILDLPPIRRSRERFLTEHEVERLAAEMGPHYAPLIFTATYTGMRWGELAGLKRPWLDLDEGIVHVRGVLERDHGSVRYREHPKSDAAFRSIRLPKTLVTVLEAHLEDQPRSEWVFLTPNGTVLRYDNFRRLWAGRKENGFNGAVRRAGLQPLVVHDLRHTHAAWAIRAGLDVLALQRRLGHKDVRTTLNVYGHLFPNHDDEFMTRLDARWRAARDENAKIVPLVTAPIAE